MALLYAIAVAVLKLTLCRNLLKKNGFTLCNCCGRFKADFVQKLIKKKWLYSMQLLWPF